ncbi:MAG: hypothetical protein GXP31_07730 [Kiritimatiellaeota bacterium]|nr:hypothetical protein [Kiritimatiellota bacterium]
MKPMLRVFLSILLPGLCANAAYLGCDYGENGQAERPLVVRPRPVPLPHPSPAPRPPAANDITQFVDKLRVARPVVYRGLTLFPVELIEQEDDTRYTTLAEALDRGWLRLRDSGEVDEVIVRNRGPRYVFLMAGELLFGGRQNRMLREDVLLWPASDDVAVPVYCVQKGRWQGGAEFDVSAGLSAFGLRRQALRGASQESVWRHVRELSQAFAVRSSTEDYGAVLESGSVNRRLEKYRVVFRRRFPRRTVGVVAARGGELLGADLFCNPRLFSALRDEVVDSFAFEAIRGRVGAGRPSENAARLFLERIRRSHSRMGPSPAAGRSLEFNGPGVHGRALVFRRAVIHLEASERAGPPLRRYLPVNRGGRELGE